jgi:hypothetical protein
MKTTTFIYLILLFTIPVYADIIPNPIQIKGIIPNGAVSIQMVSEKVTVDLFKDSSVVVCVFNMHNLGKPQDLEIGFPIMDFYLWPYDMEKYLLDDASKNNFDVTIGGKKIEKVDMYIPGKLKEILKSTNAQEGYKLLSEYTSQNKPWYLWKAHFNKNEYQRITVRYVLPNGANHMYSFFSYLLSTGAGWKGNIKDAQVTVTDKNIPVDQLLDISPKNYKRAGNIISWDFKNLKPTVDDDILIKYERVKGSYKAEITKLDSTTYYIDGKRISFSKFEKEPPGNIAGVHINRVPPNEKNPQILIYTNEYALKKFKERVKLINRLIWQQIANEPISVFRKTYKLTIDSKTTPDLNFFNKLMIIDTIKAFKISIINTGPDKKNIIVVTK